MTELAAQRDSLSLFGLDLRALWNAFAAGWAAALRWPALAWLAPDEAVRLRTVDGRELVRDGAMPERESRARDALALAIEVPDRLVLATRAEFPPMPPADLSRAVALRVQLLSPFDESDLAHGWRIALASHGSVRVDIAIASRQQLGELLRHQEPGPAGAVPELWFDATCPIVLQGFGETARYRQRRARSRQVVGLLLLAAMLLCGLAVLPVWFAAQRAEQAEQALAALERRAAPQLEKKERLARMTALFEAIRGGGEASMPPAVLLDRLTRAVPDDAVVRSMALDGSVLRVSGFASDAARLLQLLGNQPGFHNVRAPGAITRNELTGKETFAIEIDLAEAAGK